MPLTHESLVPILVPPPSTYRHLWNQEIPTVMVLSPDVYRPSGRLSERIGVVHVTRVSGPERKPISGAAPIGRLIACVPIFTFPRVGQALVLRDERSAPVAVLIGCEHDCGGTPA